MAGPDFQTLMHPVLAVHADGQPRTGRQTRDAVAQAMGLTSDDLAEMLPSGKQPTFHNRCAWSATYLVKAGLLSRPQRGLTQITDRGRAALTENAERIDIKVLNRYPEFVEFRSVRRDVGSATEATIESVSTLSPTEAIEAIVQNADAAVASEILDRILAQPPAFLERLALNVLQAMGYGGKEALLEHTGKPGDGGLDGLVRQDALGLELVGMQAKRYDRTTKVNRPEIQAFVGALQGAQTTRGVFVTTGRFSPGARQFAEQVNMRLVLIDGEELTRIMVRYDVGVTVRDTFDLKQVDEDFFEG